MLWIAPPLLSLQWVTLRRAHSNKCAERETLFFYRYRVYINSACSCRSASGQMSLWSVIDYDTWTIGWINQLRWLVLDVQLLWDCTLCRYHYYSNNCSSQIKMGVISIEPPERLVLNRRLIASRSNHRPIFVFQYRSYRYVQPSPLYQLRPILCGPVFCSEYLCLIIVWLISSCAFIHIWAFNLLHICGDGANFWFHTECLSEWQCRNHALILWHYLSFAIYRGVCLCVCPLA